jgi:restriction system protein
MAINISTSDFYESLVEFLGYKSGLVVDRSDVIMMLKEDEQLSEFGVLEEGSWIRIRSEVYEEITEYLLYRVGRLEQRSNAPPGVAMFHKYKKNPKMLAIVQDVGEEFVRHLESTLADPKTTSIDPTPFVSAMEAKHGLDGAIIAYNFMESLHVYLVRSPWGQPAAQYENTIELKGLFDSEGLAPFYGKFVDQRYIDFLYKNFERIDGINWRKFEALTGEFFDREGFYVELGPGRNDDGVDVRLWPKQPAADQPPTVVVQCKRQKAMVEKIVVKALYADVLSEKARSGLIVTTSKLSVGAQKVLKARQYPIEQADRDTLKEWVTNMRKPGDGCFL